MNSISLRPLFVAITIAVVAAAGMIQFGCGKDLAKEVEWLGKEAQK